MYNLTFISAVTTPERAFESVPELKNFNVRFFTLADSEEKIIKEAGDTDFIMADAMGKISEALIKSMPNLKLIQSEGVGYQGVDVKAAKRYGVTVCNNKGINDTAVAETAVMLILSCLKNSTAGSKAVYEGRQIEAKKASFGVVKELSQCTVGLIGFGDIAKATARLLSAFSPRILYSNRTRYPEIEQEYGVEYVSRRQLLEQSDFVSLHVAVCDDTRFMADREFFAQMKNDAYLINTSRGELVDNEALLQALLTSQIAGAGLDVIYPEPVAADNIILDDRIKDKLVLLPHIAGITNLTVQKLYKNGYNNIMRIINGEKPLNIVG